MRQVFLQRDLPASLKLLDIYFPGAWSAGPDGPHPALYEATVSADDYPRLVGNVAAGAKRMDADTRRRATLSLSHFDKPLYEEAREAKYRESGPEEAPWLPLVLECTTTMTVEGRPYPRTSYVVVDDRSSDTVRLFITTDIPYDDPKGYPPL